MTLTRAAIEMILIRRGGKLLLAADLDGTTQDGSNGDLNDPIGYALRTSGYTANVVNVTDADLAAVSDADFDQVFDLAEWRMLSSIEGNLDDVDISATDRSESWSQLARQVQTKLERVSERIQRLYSIGQGTLEAGVIGLDFMEKGTMD